MNHSCVKDFKIRTPRVRLQAQPQSKKLVSRLLRTLPELINDKVKQHTEITTQKAIFFPAECL